MRVQAHVKTPKRVVDPGRWHQGKISSSAFPLSRSPIKLGGAWRWRVLQLESATCRYRLLVAYRADKPNLYAWLAQDHPKGLAVLCCLEDHQKPHEKGLHCHALCGEDPEIPFGAQRYPGMIRVPRFGATHNRQAEFTDTSVLPLALNFFEVNPSGGDLL